MDSAPFSLGEFLSIFISLEHVQYGIGNGKSRLWHILFAK